MIFGIDEHRHVYWFYPSWTDAQSDPPAVAAPASMVLRELPDAVTQKLDGNLLQVEALFLDAPLTVKQVEGRIASFDGQPAAG